MDTCLLSATALNAALIASSVFPNPTSQYITIDYSTFNKKIIKIKLLDAIGKELYFQEQFDGSNTVLDLSKFTAGNYFLSIQTEKDSGFYKIFYK